MQRTYNTCMPKKLTFITSHPDKAEQLSWHLDYPVTNCYLDIEEIQGDCDVRRIAGDKALKAYARLKEPVLVEDVSVAFHALGRLPGPFIKWFLQDLGNEGLCRLLDNYSNRKATIDVCFALCDGDGTKFFCSSTTGEIADNPKGGNAFGMNAIFIPEGYGRTWGEMPEEEQKRTSVRRIALQQLQTYLQRLDSR